MPNKKKLAFLVNMSQLVRTEKINDRDFLIIPAVMAKCDFVMNECLYTKACFEESLIHWNGKSVVLSHPFKNGEPILAADPAVFAAQAVGTVYNTRIDGGLLKCDIYLDKGKAEAMTLGKILIELLDQNIDLDVSTGMLVLDETETTGEKDGRPYTTIVNKIIPDHLAVLISETGAATQSDGVGIPRINRLATNAADFDQITQSLCAALGENWWDCPEVFPRRRVDSVFPEFVIYREQTTAKEPIKYFKRAYLVDGSTVVLDDMFVEVVQEWVPAHPTTFGKDTIMNKKLETLVTNGVISQTVAEGMDKAGEVAIDAFVATAEKVKVNAEKVEQLTKEAGTVQTENAELKTKVNAAETRVAALEQKEVERENTAKAELIPHILTNAKDVYTEEELKGMSLPSLQKLHKMATNAAASSKTEEVEEPTFHLPPMRANSQTGTNVDDIEV